MFCTRNLSIDDQAGQVDLVKRSETRMVTNPVTCGPDNTLEEVDRLALDSGFPAYQLLMIPGVLVGIVTNRDMRFEDDMSRPVREVMTSMPLVTAPVGIAGEEALSLLRANKIENSRWSMAEDDSAA